MKSYLVKKEIPISAMSYSPKRKKQGLIPQQKKHGEL